MYRGRLLRSLVLFPPLVPSVPLLPPSLLPLPRPLSPHLFPLVIVSWSSKPSFKMRTSILVGLAALAAGATARQPSLEKRKTPWTKPNRPHRNSVRSVQMEMNYQKARNFVDLALEKRQELIPNETVAPSTSAPKDNIWRSLSNDEAASVIAYLHKQKKLNLTAVADADECAVSCARSKCPWLTMLSTVGPMCYRPSTQRSRTRLTHSSTSPASLVPRRAMRPPASCSERPKSPSASFARASQHPRLTRGPTASRISSSDLCPFRRRLRTALTTTSAQRRSPRSRITMLMARPRTTLPYALSTSITVPGAEMAPTCSKKSLRASPTLLLICSAFVFTDHRVLLRLILTFQNVTLDDVDIWGIDPRECSAPLTRLRPLLTRRRQSGIKTAA